MATSAREALRVGSAAEARDLARRAMAAEPRNPDVLHAVGELALEMGDAATAIDLLTRAIERCSPPIPALWHVLLAQALVRGGRLDDAIRTFRTGLAIDPDATAGWLGLARALHGIGDLRGAIDAWQKAIQLDPMAWPPFNDVASAWMEMREWARAEEMFAKAEGLSPGQSIVAVNRATLAQRRGRSNEAIAALEACVGRYPDYAPAHAALGFALRDAHRYGQAVAPLRRATELSPENATYACGLGRALLEAGSAEDALSQATRYLERHPGHSGARALESLTRIALGDVEGVTRLIDHRRFVSAAKLETPPGFDDLAAFNGALAAHAASHRTLMSSPISHATKDGLHSGSLLVEPRGPVAALEQAVGSAATTYWRALSSQGSPHPFVDHRPHSVYLKMWTVVLERGGHQIAHIHPEAWLSGVYYPQIPASMRGGTGPEGWLEFGEPDGSFSARIEVPTYKVRPEEGLLVLFPSYFYHRTIPFDDAGTRISIAFDIVPLGG